MAKRLHFSCLAIFSIYTHPLFMLKANVHIEKKTKFASEKPK